MSEPMTLEEYLDEDGYPTDDTLKKITEWDWKHTDKLFELLRKLWAYNEYWTQTDNGENITYNISTMGWSGNESIIDALEENYIIWHFTWIQTRRGGHYIFELPYKRQPSLVGGGPWVAYVDMGNAGDPVDPEALLALLGEE